MVFESQAHFGTDWLVFLKNTEVLISLADCEKLTLSINYFSVSEFNYGIYLNDLYVFEPQEHFQVDWSCFSEEY